MIPCVAMMHFLIVYDSRASKLVRYEEYVDSDYPIAAAERLKAEIALLDQPHMEIVVLSAESKQVIELTHGRYFKRFEELAREGIDLLDGAPSRDGAP